jgi:hypothetical protein
MEREALIEEARKFRGLGRYNDALVRFEGALQEHRHDLGLAVTVAAMMMEQGLLGDCHDRLTELEGELDRQREDPGDIAVFDMIMACSTAVATAKFTEPMARATAVYERCIVGRPVDAFDKKLVSQTPLLTMSNWNIEWK